MKTFRRFSVITILYGWISHSFSVFGIPFIDIIEPARINTKTFLSLYTKLNDFVLLTRELNETVYNTAVYGFRSVAGVINVLIISMVVLSVIGLLFPRARIIKSVALYNGGIALVVSVLVSTINDYYGVRMFANPANNIIFWMGVMFTFTSSFVVSTVVNEETKREGFSL